MPRMSRTRNVSRLNLEFSAELRERLESLREASGAESLVQVIRNALAVYEFAWSVKRSGGTLIARNGEKEREIVLM